MALKQKITNSSIKNLTIKDKRLNDTEVSGFHARISPKGTVKYYLYYRINGKQRNFFLGAANSLTPAQARDLAKEKSGQVASGEDVQESRHEAKKLEAREGLTLTRFLDEHYQDYLIALNPRTANQSFNSIKNTFAHLGDKRLSDITARDIQEWYTQKRKQGRAPATMSRTFMSFKAALTRAVEWELLDSHSLDKVKLVTEDNTRVRYLSSEEESALLTALDERNDRLRTSGSEKLYSDFIKPLVITAINTGARKSELLSLSWEDVSFENRYLTVKAENAKSKKTRRIPLNDTVFNLLSKWRAQNPSQIYVFTPNHRDSAPLIQYPWQCLLKAADITNFRFHDLRHHFASKLVTNGVDLNTVRELLGHSDLKMTLRYAHLAPEHKAAAVNLIG